MKKLSYDTEDILDAFSISRNISNCEELSRLFASTDKKIAPNHVNLLEERRLALLNEGDFWNEEELKMQFLAFLFYIVDINEPGKIKTFYERSLKATLGEYTLSVVCDMLLATPKGIGKPKHPYFFLQEFKKAKNAPDAEGQMLTAMLIAQYENANQKPVYGCFIQGKHWTFATLHGKTYCLSRTLDATDIADLQDIVNGLHSLKDVILSDLVSQ